MSKKRPPTSDAADAPDPLRDYRQWLVQTDHQASLDFDKAIVTLAGGALAISITLIRPDEKHHEFLCLPVLAASWGFLTASLLAGLASLVIGRRALQRCIKQVDCNTIYDEVPGGRWTLATEWLDIAAVLFVVVGIALLVAFAYFNLGRLA